MVSKEKMVWGVFLCALVSILSIVVSTQVTASVKKMDIAQGQVVLTPSESKRLIAKAVAQMPEVKKALQDGIIIITKGTTNTYVAEEILGKKIAHGAYVYGKVYPAKGGKKLGKVDKVPEVILVKGKVDPDVSMSDAIDSLQPGDVVIKGANALDYNNKTAGVIVGSSAGTTGRIMPKVIGEKVHLIIPVGLEKQVAGNVIDISRKMREPVESINKVYSMFLITGTIVTEIEALEIMADVEAFQVAAGGIGGAEGAVRLVCRGDKKEVEKAIMAAELVQGEPAFVK